MRSPSSGGTAHSGSSSSHGDTEASSTNRVTIRAALATLASSWRGAAASCRRLAVEPFDLGEVVRPFQMRQPGNPADQRDQLGRAVDGDPVGQGHRLGRADRAQHPADRHQAADNHDAPDDLPGEPASAPSTSSR